MNAQKGSLKQKIKIWLREIRAPFLTATLIPVCFGASLAWYYHASFQLFPFLITLIAAVLLHMGTNLANDYFDHKSGADAINEDFIPGFSGGSRLIQEGILDPRTVYHAAIFCFASAMVLSISLILYRGPLILVLGIIDVGQFVNVGQTVSNVSRKGARLAARNTTLNTSEVEAAVSSYVTAIYPSIPASAIQVTVLDGAGGAIAGADLTTINTGSPISVQVVLQFDPVRWLTGLTLLDNRTITTTTVTRRE